MIDRREVITIFSRCFRLLAKLSAGLSDKFFSEILDKEFENLFSDYLFFLRNTAPAQNNHVAQYNARLFSRVQNIITLVKVCNYLNLNLDRTCPLLLERDLLSIKLFLLSVKNQKQQKVEKEVVKIVQQPVAASVQISIGQGHNRIMQLMNGHEQVRNVEIFQKIPEISKRTLKRKLHELIEAGFLKRTANGKIVFYSLANRPEPHGN
ncbi:MAG TPA: winged helix-turn-helix transcriptional regulator [Candidatus Paceibacterota bacterium]